MNSTTNAVFKAEQTAMKPESLKETKPEGFRVSNRRARLWVIATGVFFLLAVGVFMTYDLKGSLEYALTLRGKKVLAMTLVGTGLATASVLFHTVSANRILTPSLIGLDSLYILIQTLAATFFGVFVYLRVDARVRFALALGIMMLFAIGLNKIFISKAATDLPLLILGGIVMGGMFGSISALGARLIDPNEYVTFQDLLFASFATINEQLLGFSILVVLVCLLVTWRYNRELDLMTLGRAPAIGMGSSFDRVNRIVMILVAVLVSVPTALVGPVRFLGLLASNAAYELTGSFRHRFTIPVASFFAASMLIAAQFIVEEVFGFRTRVSMVIGFVGGIAFVVLLMKEARR